MKTCVFMIYANGRYSFSTPVKFSLLGGLMTNESSTPSFTRKRVPRNAPRRNRFTRGRNDPGCFVVTRPRKAEHVCFLGGKLEVGETFLDAAVRELREETGLLVSPDRLVQVFRAPCVGDGGAPWFDVAFFVLLDTLEAVPGPEEPELEARFVAPLDLLEHSPFAHYNLDAFRAFALTAPVLVARGLLDRQAWEAMEPVGAAA